MSRSNRSGGVHSVTKRKKSNVSMGLALGIALGLVVGMVLWGATSSFLVGLGTGVGMGLLAGLGIGKLFDSEDPRMKSGKRASSRQRRLSSGRQ